MTKICTEPSERIPRHHPVRRRRLTCVAAASVLHGAVLAGLILFSNATLPPWLEALTPELLTPASLALASVAAEPPGPESPAAMFEFVMLPVETALSASFTDGTAQESRPSRPPATEEPDLTPAGPMRAEALPTSPIPPETSPSPDTTAPAASVLEHSPDATPQQAPDPAEHPPVQPPAPKPAEARPALRKAVPTPLPGPARQAAASPHAAPPSQSPSPAPQSPSQAAPEITAGYAQRLSQYLERYRRYPPVSRQRREEGVALLRFSVASNGDLLTAAVERSSGFAYLDEAALDMLRRAAPLPGFPVALGDRPLNLVYPVRFRLE